MKIEKTTFTKNLYSAKIKGFKDTEIIFDDSKGETDQFYLHRLFVDKEGDLHEDIGSADEGDYWYDKNLVKQIKEFKTQIKKLTSKQAS